MKKRSVFFLIYISLILISALVLLGCSLFLIYVILNVNIFSDHETFFTAIICVISFICMSMLVLTIYTVNKSLLFFKNLILRRIFFLFYLLFSSLIAAVTFVFWVIFFFGESNPFSGIVLMNVTNYVLLALFILYSILFIYTVILMLFIPRFNLQLQIKRNHEINLAEFEDVTNTINCNLIFTKNTNATENHPISKN